MKDPLVRLLCTLGTHLLILLSVNNFYFFWFWLPPTHHIYIYTYTYETLVLFFKYMQSIFVNDLNSRHNSTVNLRMRLARGQGWRPNGKARTATCFPDNVVIRICNLLRCRGCCRSRKLRIVKSSLSGHKRGVCSRDIYGYQQLRWFIEEFNWRNAQECSDERHLVPSSTWISCDSSSWSDSVPLPRSLHKIKW